MHPLRQISVLAYCTLTRYSMSRCTHGQQSSVSVENDAPLQLLEWHNRETHLKTFGFISPEDEVNIGSPVPMVSIEEVPIKDAGVGHVMWTTGVGMALWTWGQRARVVDDGTNAEPGLFHGKQVIEIGAGLGLPGLSVAALQEPASISISDSRSTLITNLESAAARARSAEAPASEGSIASRLKVEEFNWMHAYQSGSLGNREGSADVVMGSEIVSETVISNHKQMLMKLHVLTLA